MKTMSLNQSAICSVFREIFSLRSIAPYHKRRAWIELDMNNLKHNVEVLSGLLPKGCALMPAVKANAYGHGAGAICRALNHLGIRAFCVATVYEGVALRKQHIKGDILILGYTHPELFPLLRRYRLTQTVLNYEYGKALNGYGKRLKVHVKIDTGMRRLGEPSENMENILRIFELKGLHITGIFTHFSAQSSRFTQAQVNAFNTVLAQIKAHGHAVPRTHAQSSYGLIDCPGLSFDYCRAGIAIYGVYQHCKLDLRPVLSVKARVSIVKNVRAGEAVGYGDAFFAGHDMSIAILSIGYADGIPRALSCGVGHVLLGGAIAPIVGNICMDMMTVDVTKLENVKQGDIAVLLGEDGKHAITAFDLAAQAGTIPNEILSRLGSRLEK